jgi:hypothetical protein
VRKIAPLSLNYAGGAHPGATHHIFAVNGLRLAIFFGIIFGLFRALGLPRPLSGLVLIPLIWINVDAQPT